jgi:agmatine/peptidylarginine deiminase
MRLQNYFPGRDVYVLPMLKSWSAGGGVHCHTNDQPAQLSADVSLPDGRF